MFVVRILREIYHRDEEKMSGEFDCPFKIFQWPELGLQILIELMDYASTLPIRYVMLVLYQRIIVTFDHRSLAYWVWWHNVHEATSDSYRLIGPCLNKPQYMQWCECPSIWSRLVFDHDVLRMLTYIKHPTLLLRVHIPLTWCFFHWSLLRLN